MQAISFSFFAGSNFFAPADIEPDPKARRSEEAGIPLEPKAEKPGYFHIGNPLLEIQYMRALKLLLLVTVGALHAVNAPATPPVLKVPWTSTIPKLEAEPAEAVWDFAAIIPELSLSLKPDKEDLAVLPTEVRVLWHESGMYVRFVSSAQEIFTPHGTVRDAPHYEGDVVEVFLDPMGDARQVIELQVNPKGGIMDVLFLATDEPVSNQENVLLPEFRNTNWWTFPDWNLEGLRTATSVHPREDGSVVWVADIFIPSAEMLRRSGDKKLSPRSMRANFLRYDGPKDEVSGKRAYGIFMNWAPVRYGMPHASPHAMGTLELSAPE